MDDVPSTRFDAATLVAGEAGVAFDGLRGVVRLTGDLDMTSRAVLERVLENAVRTAPADIDVDVRAVTFIDAHTVGILFNALHHAARTGRRLRVTGAGDTVRRVLHACHAATLLGGESTAAADMPPRRTACSSITGSGPVRLPGLCAGGGADAVRAAWEQRRIDEEVRSSRRRLLARLRTRLAADPLAMLDPEFMAVADGPTLLRAMVATATTVGAANACDVQLYDAGTQSLRMAYQEGFDPAFVDYFATVDADCPTACGAALASGEPVLIDDITQSPIFARQPSLDVMLAAGSRAVRSYPLRDHQHHTIGMLSFHYRRPRPRDGNPEAAAWAATEALGYWSRK